MIDNAVAGNTRFPDLPVPPQCRETIRANAVVAINHSGGNLHPRPGS